MQIGEALEDVRDRLLDDCQTSGLGRRPYGERIRTIVRGARTLSSRLYAGILLATLSASAGDRARRRRNRAHAPVLRPGRAARERAPRLIHEDHRTPIAAVNLWYHVG